MTAESSYAFYAFYALYSHYHEVPTLTLQDIQQRWYPNEEPADPKQLTSLFITWKTKGDDLRGCIGTFAKLPLEQGIARYSLVAALQDSRFPPIPEREIHNLHCGCNILRNFVTIYEHGISGDINNWQIGTHGIELQFKDPRTSARRSATFLPEVMSEQHWDIKETFINLISKAGCPSQASKILDNYSNYFIKVIRYEGIKSEISYDQFQRKLREISNDTT